MELGMVNEMKHGTQNRTCNGTWKLEHAMEHGNWNMQWKMEWDIEWNMQWNGTCFIFYKSQNSSLQLCVFQLQQKSGTDPWNTC